MKIWQAVAVGGILAAVVTNAENESPGATARSVATLRQSLTPVVQESVGVIGDGVMTVRNEASRQGLDPAAAFSQPSVGDGRDVQSVPEPTLPVATDG